MTSVSNLQEVFEAGRYGDVVRQWNAEDRQILSEPEGAYVVAAAHLRLGDFQRAQEICELIEGPFGNNANFLSMYAVILRRQGLYERAEGIFQKALDLDPNAKDVRNNFSNLLIDQGRFPEAKDILEKLIKEEPNYQDAKNNLHRLKELEISAIARRNGEAKVSKDFKDPLDAAFEVEEVIKCGAKLGEKTASLMEIIDQPTNNELEQADLEMLTLANQQVEKKQYRGALELCSKVRQRRGPKPSIYKIASDAFIGLELFPRAEMMSLTALALGEETVANYINLSSLSAMRNDQKMARFWLNNAKRVDPKNDAIKQCEEVLFPKGSARGDDDPLKL